MRKGLSSVASSRVSGLRFATAPPIVFILWLAFVSSPALAASHPFLFSFGSFVDPNGIAIDRSSGDVYVADIGTSGVQKFDAAGNPVDFSALGSNTLDGSATPAGSFSFPASPGNPAAVAIDNSNDPTDPSAGDLYVVDGGHDVIDKFAPDGSYLGQITGPADAAFSEILGLGIDAAGNVRVDELGNFGSIRIDVFDNSLDNSFLIRHLPASNSSGLAMAQGPAFAVSPAGVGYALFSCGCFLKFGPNVEELGQVDGASEGIAIAVDGETGHVLIDDQSSIAEWDTGAMNGTPTFGLQEPIGTFVSSFGSSQLSASAAGGLAVDAASGEIYVSNPADGKIYVFASTPPAVAASPASKITKTAATLHATVNPRGTPVTSCQFEYGSTPAFGEAGPSLYDHTVSCDLTPAQIGAGTSPVSVSAEIGGLQPGSLYHFRLTAANSEGVSPSAGLFATAGPGFGIGRFEVSFTNQDGTPDTQAGSHPYQMTTYMSFNTKVVRREKSFESRYVTEPDGNFKDLIINYPPGMVGDPNATKKKCTLAELNGGGIEGSEANCPQSSFVGYIKAEFPPGSGNGSSTLTKPVYNMVPPRGVAAQFAANFIIPTAFINLGVTAGGQYPVTASVENPPVTIPIVATKTTIFGIPPEGKPLITLPTGCTGRLRSTIAADSYQEPGRFVEATALTRDAAGSPIAPTGCAKLRFPPTIGVSPDVSNASSSSGLAVNVHISQSGAQNPNGLAESNLKDATVTLPEGVTINPSGADGQQGCPESLAGFSGFTEFNPQFEPGVETATFTPTLPAPLLPGANLCPDASKVGTVTIHSPLIPNPLEGAVYLATPHENPFGSLLALYLIAEDPVSGTIIKQAGEVHLDPLSGQLTTTFRQTPDVPFEDLTLHFFGGDRAPLVTPALCGTYTTHAVLTPWDGNGDVPSDSSFTVDHGQNGSACPSGAAAPFHPQLSAGTANNRAGSYSPLDLELSRGDSEQEFTHFSLKLPPGLSGKLAGVAKCSEAQIGAAKAREHEGGGAEEQQSPSCPQASEIGHTLVGAGVGSVLVWAPGNVYLAGPYHGSPLSVVAITAAKAGPFDLGTVVVRDALRVNPETAEVFVDATGSDPLPHIIDGIPTHLRKILVYLDRPEFALNPTSCERMSIASTVLGSGADFTTEADDNPLTVTSPFQAADCAALPFKPRLKLHLKGKTGRGGTPALRAEVRPRPGEANIAKTVVTLPHSEFLDQAHIGTVCTRVQFNAGAGNGAGCPAASVYGHARAVTPILSEALEGPVFLRSSEHKLPDLVAALHGAEIDIDLVGRVDSVGKGQIRTSFESVPDAPVSKFVLSMAGGKKGLLENSTDICAKRFRAKVQMTGHNGKLHDFAPLLKAHCPKHHKRKGRHHRRGHGRHRGGHHAKRSEHRRG